MQSSNIPSQNLDMTLISVFYDAGINELRKIATKRAVSRWIKQSSLPKEMLFVELGFNGTFTFSESDFPKPIQYVRIQGNEDNKYLFQKEHLWNIMARQAKHDKLMFVDSDISPLKDVDWFKKVSAALDKCLFTQGFHELTYLSKSDAPTSRKKLSYSSSYAAGEPLTSKTSVPGGVYCIRKSTLKKIGWFNYMPFGGGDNLFWCEFVGDGSQNLNVILQKRTFVKGIVDSMAKGGLKDILPVYVNVAHFYHGELKNRSHTQRSYLLLTHHPWEGKLIADDGNGLLHWVDMNHHFVKVMSRLHTLNDSAYKAAALLAGKMDYLTFIKKVDAMMKLRKQMTRTQLKETLEKIIAATTVAERSTEQAPASSPFGGVKNRRLRKVKFAPRAAVRCAPRGFSFG